MFEIGSTLRETRVRRKTTLQQAEDDTKIRVKYIQAMENDDFDLMPSPAYVKGFLRTYSTYLGLDADVMLDEYRSRFEPNEEHEPFGGNSALGRPHAHRRRNTLTFIAVVCLLILGLLYVWPLQLRRQDTDTAAGHRHQPLAAAEPVGPASSPRRRAGSPCASRPTGLVLGPGPQDRHRRPDRLPGDHVPGPGARPSRTGHALSAARRAGLRHRSRSTGKSSFRPAETVSTNYEVTRKGVVKL